MKNKWIFLLWFISLSGTLFAQSAFRHKSEAEIAQMTPSQRVIEYCEDYVYHGSHFPNEYTKFLSQSLFNDGVKTFPQIIRIFDEFDPAKMKYGFDEHFKKYQAAYFLLSDFEASLFRIRGLNEGKGVIEALKRSVERMRSENYKNDKPVGDEMWRRYSLVYYDLQFLNGLSLKDSCVGSTLKGKYEIDLTEKELLDFVNYLIVRDPRYPSWSKTEIPRIGLKYCLYKKPELFHQAYLDYQAIKK